MFTPSIAILLHESRRHPIRQDPGKSRLLFRIRPLSLPPTQRMVMVLIATPVPSSSSSSCSRARSPPLFDPGKLFKTPGPIPGFRLEPHC